MPTNCGSFSNEWNNAIKLAVLWGRKHDKKMFVYKTKEYGWECAAIDSEYHRYHRNHRALPTADEILEEFNLIKKYGQGPSI